MNHRHGAASNNATAVQIDKSKVGKRKYHRGHRIEGEWEFGGIEQDFRKCFIRTVEDRSEAILLPIIKKWIAPLTPNIQISDCWKSYLNLKMHGYAHETVNHSKEFANKNGKQMNKIEGQWRHVKTGLPEFGRRKYMYSGHILTTLCGVVYIKARICSKFF